MNDWKNMDKLKYLIYLSFLLCCISAGAQTYTCRDAYTFVGSCAHRLGAETVEIATDGLGDISVTGSGLIFLSDDVVLLSPEGLAVLRGRGRDFASARVPDCRAWSAETPHVYTLRVSRRNAGSLELPVVFRSMTREAEGLSVNGRYVSPHVACPSFQPAPFDVRDFKAVGYDALAADSADTAVRRACYEHGVYLLDRDDCVGMARLDRIDDMSVIRQKSVIAASNRPVRTWCSPDGRDILVESGRLVDGASLDFEAVSDRAGHLYYGTASLGQLRYDGVVEKVSLPECDYHLGGDVYLTLDYCDGSGNVVCKDQILLRRSVRAYSPKGGHADVSSTSGGIRFKGRGWEAEFDDASCLPDTYRLEEKEMLVTPIRPLAWAPTGNSYLFTIERGYLARDCEDRTIRCDISGSGEMETEVCTPGEKAGVTFTLPEGAVNVRYFGRGPERESRPGMGGGRLGEWRDSGECSHVDLRWMEVTDSEGRGFGIWSALDFVGSVTPGENGVTVSARGLLDAMTFYIYPIK